MAVSKRLRFEVLRRDNHACRYCGRSAPEVRLTVDHVVPVALGGSDDPENLVSACIDCNAGKSSSNPDAPLVADVAADALRWAEALKLAEAKMRAEIFAHHDQHTDFWERWESCEPAAGSAALPPGWQHTIDRLLSAGLSMAIIGHCLGIATANSRVMPSDRFRYMCGVAWKRVTELQQSAREIVARPQPAPCMLADPDDTKCTGEARYLFWLTECTMCCGGACVGHLGFCERHMEGAVKTGAVYNSDEDIIHKIADFAEAVTA